MAIKVVVKTTNMKNIAEEKNVIPFDFNLMIKRKWKRVRKFLVAFILEHTKVHFATVFTNI